MPLPTPQRQGFTKVFPLQSMSLLGTVLWECFKMITFSLLLSKSLWNLSWRMQKRQYLLFGSFKSCISGSSKIYPCSEDIHGDIETWIYSLNIKSSIEQPSYVNNWDGLKGQSIYWCLSITICWETSLCDTILHSSVCFCILLSFHFFFLEDHAFIKPRMSYSLSNRLLYKFILY